ncbi:hypothetical protein Pelo_8105 [Pelomyxa schiedti]|nr:hypothetical protein Pelo_8105 [Pelomyxa schiedti]
MDIHTRDPWLPSALHDSLCITVLLLGISVAVNGLGATLFASALDMSDSSLRVTALSFSSNFVLTGVVGWLLFHEGIGLKWVCGSALILAGVGILSKQQQHKPNKNP